MKNKLKKILVLLLIVGVIQPGVLWAAYEDLGTSARVTAMGNAYTAVADDAYAIYYNPAGLATLDRPEVASTYAKLLTGLSDNSNLQNSFVGYAQPIKDGKWGTAGLGWNYFSLDSLYEETQFFGSYGHSLFADAYPNKFYGGISLKMLNRSLNPGSVANDAIGPTGIATGMQDPVLQHTSKMNFDEDVGFLWRVKPRWTLGFDVQHLLEPNVAFATNDTDTLQRNYKFGGAYKTPFSTLSADFDLVSAADGTMGKQLAFGTEKWLPTLTYGTFGIRGSLAVGDNSYRQLGAGISYKVHRMQFDYGFTIPLGGIAGTTGTHRIGLTFRFGQPKEARPAFGEAMLENIAELGEVGTPQFKAELQDLALYTRKAVEEFLRQAKIDMGLGHFSDALGKISDAVSLRPGDLTLTNSQDRLKAVSDLFPEVGNFSTDAGQAAVYDTIQAFVSGDDQGALKKVDYALSLNPGNDKLEALKRAIAQKAVSLAGPVISTVTVTVYVPQVSTVTVYVPQTTTKTVYVHEPKAPAVKPEIETETVVMPKPELMKLVGADLALMEVALRQGDNAKAVKLAMEVVRLDPNNVLAYKRMGIAYAALKNYSAALKSLRSAYKLETDPEAKTKLRFYINGLVPLLEKQAVKTAPGELPIGVMTPQDIERLYEAGVDLYAQGRLLEARKVFRRILEQEPNNVSARRASDRIDADILGGEKK
jgi:tetratricopeptide (TPR) repeat protein